MSGVLEVLRWVCGAAGLVAIAGTLAIVIWAYYKIRDREPGRTKEDWSKRIRQSLKGSCESNATSGRLMLISDEDSPEIRNSFKILGAVNVSNWLMAILIEGGGLFPQREVLVAPRKYLRNIHTREIQLIANGLTVWGDLLIPVPSSDWEESYGYWEAQITRYFDTQALNLLASATIAKANGEVVGVMDLSPQKANLIDRVIGIDDRLVGGNRDGTDRKGP